MGILSSLECLLKKTLRFFVLALVKERLAQDVRTVEERAVTKAKHILEGLTSESPAEHCLRLLISALAVERVTPKIVDLAKMRV